MKQSINNLEKIGGKAMKKLKLLSLFMLLVLVIVGCATKTEVTTSADDTTKVESKEAQETKDNTKEADATKEVKRPVELTLTMRTEWYKEGWQAVEKHINENADALGFSLKIDKIAGGAEGDQIIKARFATGDISDFIEQSSVSEHALNYGGINTVVEIDGDWTANFPDSLLSSSIYSNDGKIYGMPIDSTQLTGMFYNKRVFEEAGAEVPTTWDELLVACEQIKAYGVTPVYFSSKDAWTTTFYLNEGFIREYDVTPEQEFYAKLNTGKLKFEDMDLLKDTMIKSKELIDLGYAQSSFLADTYDNAQQALAEGTAAMYPNATWVIDEINSKYPEKVNDIGAFAIPFDDKGRSSSFAPFALMMTSNCKDKEVGMKFIEYIGSVEVQQLFASAQPGLWTCEGVTSEVLTAVSDMVAWLDEGRVNVWYGSQMTYPQDVALAEHSQAFLAGAESVDDAMKAVDSEMIKQAKAKGDVNFAE